MLTLKIEDEKVEQIFLNEFHSNKEKFFTFIQESYEKMKVSKESHLENNFLNVQESSMAQTWDNSEDRAWNEL